MYNRGNLGRHPKTSVHQSAALAGSLEHEIGLDYHRLMCGEMLNVEAAGGGGSIIKLAVDGGHDAEVHLNAAAGPGAPGRPAARGRPLPCPGTVPLGLRRKIPMSGPMETARTKPCPICGEPADGCLRPFCS